MPLEKLPEGLGLAGYESGQPREQDCDPNAVAKREVAITKQRAEAVADLRCAATLVDHGQLERQPPDVVAAPDPLEELQILGEAAERDVLAVVRRRLGITLPLRQRLHLAAKSRPGLEQGHVMAGVDELQRRREPGQAAPNHDCLHLRISNSGTEPIHHPG